MNHNTSYSYLKFQRTMDSLNDTKHSLLKKLKDFIIPYPDKTKIDNMYNHAANLFVNNTFIEPEKAYFSQKLNREFTDEELENTEAGCPEDIHWIIKIRLQWKIEEKKWIFIMINDNDTYDIVQWPNFDFLSDSSGIWRKRKMLNTEFRGIDCSNMNCDKYKNIFPNFSVICE